MKVEPGEAFSRARAAYDNGMPLPAIKRRLHMTESEMRDAFPEEYEDDPASERRNGY